MVGTDLEITIDEIPEEDYADSKLTVIGTINGDAYAVWVNGVRAYDPILQGSTYEWYAEDVRPLEKRENAVKLAARQRDNWNRPHLRAARLTLPDDKMKTAAESRTVGEAARGTSAQLRV